MTAAAILKEKLYIPVTQIDDERMEAIRKEFTLSFYDEKACKSCENLPDRHNDICDKCEAFQGTFRFWKRSKNKKYIGVSIGDRHAVKRVLPRGIKIVDKRADHKMEVADEIRFRWSASYDYQKEAVNELIDTGYGALKSAPRTGKTVMGAMLAIKLKRKTLILAHQEDLLKQFYKTFMAKHPEIGNKRFTNCHKLERKYRRPVVKICTTLKDFENTDICLATYQQFLSEGGKIKLEAIKDMFGLVITDELHKGGATEYSKVLDKFSAKFRYGMTATYKRKDGKHLVVMKVVGPVVHATTAKALTPYLTLAVTDTKPARPYKTWTGAMRFLERRCDARNALVVKHAVREVEKGHSVLIPGIFKSQINDMVKAINKKAGRKIAAGWHGDLSDQQRDDTLMAARAGDVKVIVAMRSMLTGINVPRWSCLIEYMPMNNPPNFEQEFNRICTPMEGKKRPKIIFVVDRWSLSVRCFFSCYQVLKQFKVPLTDKALESMRGLKSIISDYESGGSEYTGKKRTYDKWASVRTKTLFQPGSSL